MVLIGLFHKIIETECCHATELKIINYLKL